MIYTGKYKNCYTKLLKTYSISKEKDESYTGPEYPELFPKSDTYEIWKSNIGVIPEEDNNKYFIKEYYEQVLKFLDPEKVYQKINNSVLLCDEFYRHIVAFWLEYHLNIKSYEIKIKDEKIILLDRPKYIETFLEELMSEEPLIRKKEVKSQFMPIIFDD